MKIPEGEQAVMPYLMLHDAPAFIDFVKNSFKGELTYKKLRDDNQKIMHAQVKVSGSTIMFCEATDQWTPQPASMFVYVDNADESYAAALENGATSIMELTDQPYGRTCGVKDPCGNTWWVTSVL